MLLWGPPGCGKTLVARAVAGEMGAQFINVALNDVLSMWLGNSEKNIHAVFESARNQAPALLFFDELDAIGHKRTGFANTSGRNVVAQMLMEMEGVASDNTGVYMLAATNQPWAVDPALRRPGRFDRTILVLPPDEAARRAILAYHLKDRPVAPLDLRPFAAETEGFSGADLGLVCRDAAELAMAESLASGTVRPIDAADLATALKGVRPSTLEWMATAQNFAADSRSSGEYDGLLEYLKGCRSGDGARPLRLPGRPGRSPCLLAREADARGVAAPSWSGPAAPMPPSKVCTGCAFTTSSSTGTGRSIWPAGIRLARAG